MPGTVSSQPILPLLVRLGIWLHCQFPGLFPGRSLALLPNIRYTGFMDFRLEVKYIDGTTKTVVGMAADFVAFETKFDLSMARLEKEIRLTHLFFLGWHIEKRTGNTKLDFEPWLELVEMVQAADTKK